MITTRLAEQAARPRKDFAQPEEHRQKEQRHHRHRRKRGERKIAQRQSPPSAGEELHHEDDERAEGKSDPEKPGEQIGLEKLRATNERAAERESGRDEADDE